MKEDLENNEKNNSCVIAVDLDGTLTPSDTLYEVMLLFYA